MDSTESTSLVTETNDESTKSQATLDLAEKLRRGLEHKQAGNAHFSAGDWALALKEYHFANLHIKGLTYKGPMGKSTQMTNEEEAVCEKTLLDVTRNMAACYLKQERWDKALSACNDVLAKEGKENGSVSKANAKTLFRKATALEALGQADQALESANAAYKLQPTDTATLQLIKRLKTQAQIDQKQADQIWRGMYSK